MNIIGRLEEKKILEKSLKSKKPEFIVVYGRRRIGKTYLIKNYFENKFSFYTSGLNDKTYKIQLNNFKNSLIEYGLDIHKNIPNWMEAFSYLKKLLESDKVYRHPLTNKRIIFLDELPWMDGRRSDFKAALDLFWNTYASSKEDIVLIVCGSATSWIMKNMIKDEGGFYNRITKKIHLIPFTLDECKQYSDSLDLPYNTKQISELYMVFGGVPYYWDFLDGDYSVAQNIDNLFFKENSQLKDEYQSLFKSLFSLKGKHRQIIEELMKNNHGLQRKQLSSIKSIGDGKSLTTALEELCECDFIRAYDNFLTSKNGKYYQIIDPFILFAKNFLLNSKIYSWHDFINTPNYYSWSGYAFEIMCINNIQNIKEALGISEVGTKLYSWRSKTSKKGAQIDLLIERKDQVINICEIKYTLNEFEINKDYELNLINKMEAFRSETKCRQQLVLTLISFNGLKENSHSEIINKLITIKDLTK